MSPRFPTWQGMFMYAFDYNHPLQAWDVSSVTNSRIMFWEAYKFNQPLNAWDVSQVTNWTAVSATSFALVL